MSLYEDLPIVMGYIIGAYLVFGKAMICAARGWCRCEGGASMGLGRAGRGRAVCYSDAWYSRAIFCASACSAWRRLRGLSTSTPLPSESSR